MKSLLVRISIYLGVIASRSTGYSRRATTARAQANLKEEPLARCVRSYRNLASSRISIAHLLRLIITTGGSLVRRTVFFCFFSLGTIVCVLHARTDFLLSNAKLTARRRSVKVRPVLASPHHPRCPLSLWRSAAGPPASTLIGSHRRLIWAPLRP